MTTNQQILFVQGAGAGAHDDWDAALVDSLSRELGAGYEVRYPRMPDEGDPSHATWGNAISAELTRLPAGAFVVGHSVGGTLLALTLSEQASLAKRASLPELASVVLIAAPFLGADGWPSETFELRGDLGARLPPGLRVHLFHGLNDETVPPSHAQLYARTIPQAQLHLLPGRDHQLNNDLSQVAMVISADVDRHP